ncbi:hypothetical protein [Comamonas odontotermitis]|uniref:hypothetical protein n=1 Tax=Comamonas odontotermitis TaxID=379895 RepID=UPI0037517934
MTSEKQKPTPESCNQAETTDWKEIALALARRVNFAVANCQCRSGFLMDMETMKPTGWREYLVEAMEMIPGVKVDREILATLELPPSKRKKAQAEIKATRAALAKHKEV